MQINGRACKLAQNIQNCSCALAAGPENSVSIQHNCEVAAWPGRRCYVAETVYYIVAGSQLTAERPKADVTSKEASVPS